MTGWHVVAFLAGVLVGYIGGVAHAAIRLIHAITERRTDVR